jgi:hypothetical protein
MEIERIPGGGYRLSGEVGFDAQDERPFGIQGSPGEAERLDDLERRWAEVGCDLWGFPKES